MRRFTLKKRIFKRNKSYRLKRKLGGSSGHNIGILPSSFCSVAPDYLPVQPTEPLIADSAPFPKPWVNVNSNILFVALVISQDSALGEKITEINTIRNIAYFEPTGNALNQPHISLLNVYIPELESDALHSILNSNKGFEHIAYKIKELVKTYIIKPPYNSVLRSTNNKYEHFGNFVVKKYTDNTRGDFSRFLNEYYTPFKTEFVAFLSALLHGASLSVSSCYPAYFPKHKPVQVFRHYSVNKSSPIKSSDFAISKYFEDDLKPHISLYKSSYEEDRNDFIEGLKKRDLEVLNEVELSPHVISSVYISYNGFWINIPTLNSY
jgi:hypothetical protein